MKKALLSSFIMLACMLSSAQVPESFSYQVVVREGTNPLTNQNVSFQMNILKGSTSGDVVYTEYHAANTGALGIVNLVIGKGTGKVGDIATIDWGADSYFLKVSIDKTGGEDYVEMGTTQLLSVPYAFYSKTYEKADELEQKLQMLKNTVIAGGILTDIDGNSYNTVKIGMQIWMAENLKTTKYSNGIEIILVDTEAQWDMLTETDKAYCWYGDNSDNKSVYGALYTWAAAMNGSTSSSSSPSGVQGICPTGWHIPSDGEWHTLILGLDSEAQLYIASYILQY